MKSLSKHKNDIINILTLVIISLIIVLVLVNFTNFFGSKKDWISQHVMFPDYLRKLFYDTGDIFLILPLILEGDKISIIFLIMGFLIRLF